MVQNPAKLKKKFQFQDMIWTAHTSRTTSLSQKISTKSINNFISCCTHAMHRQTH